MIGFLHQQSVAVRETSIIEPRFVIIESIRLSYERVVIYPFAD